MQKSKIIIEGMHCASCAANVEKSLMKNKGIKKASVNAIIGKAIVESDDSVTEDDLKKAVKDAGYTPVEIETD